MQNTIDDDACDLRSAVLRQLLSALATTDGWAVLKGWADLPRITGDLDLIVDPHRVDELVGIVVAALRPLAQNGFIARCDHIPRVPRVLAHLPTHGFDAEILEIDLAHVLPTRAAALITLARLTGHVEFHDGYWRTTAATDAAVKYITRDLGWWSSSNLMPAGSESAVATILGPRRMRLAALAHRWPLAAVILTASLLLRSLMTPAQLVERMLWRVKPIRCPFDPRHGRSSRHLGGRSAVDVERCGHKLF